MEIICEDTSRKRIKFTKESILSHFRNVGVSMNNITRNGLLEYIKIICNAQIPNDFEFSHIVDDTYGTKVEESITLEFRKRDDISLDISINFYSERVFKLLV